MKDEAKLGYIIRGKMCQGIDPLEENPSPSNETPNHRVLGDYEPYCNKFHAIDFECWEIDGIQPSEICQHLSGLHGSGKIWKNLGKHKIVGEEYSARCNWPLDLTKDENSSS